jgi:flagellar biosynthetic protein FliR
METVLADEITRLGVLFARLGTCLMLVPGIGEVAVMPQVRLGFGLLLTLLLYPALAPQLEVPTDDAGLLRLLAAEIVIGCALGFAIRMALASLELAGSVVAMQSGLAAAALFDPQQGGQTTLPGRFLAITGLTLFLVLDGHHQLLALLATSYRLMPPSGTAPVANFAEDLLLLSAALWSVAVAIAAPVLIVTILTSTVFGLFTRLVPGIQVFFIAMPLQIALAILAMVAGISAALGVFLRFADDTLAGLISGG